MNYQDFLIDVKTHIQAVLGTDTKLSVHHIAKNNGVHYDGLIIMRKGCNISPTLFLNHYYHLYQEGMELEEIYEDILRTYYSKLPPKGFDANFFLDFEQVRPHIIPKLIHYEKNLEQLQDLPHIRFLDLAVVFQCLVCTSSNEQATILVRNEHAEGWKITTDELYQLALRNAPLRLPYQFGNLRDILCEHGLMNWPSKEMEPQMYLLTNQNRINGAAVLLYPGLTEELAAYFSKDLVIIPSSIHELLIIPVDLAQIGSDDLDGFSVMVREVNRDHVVDDEILSDHAYLYERSIGELRIL